MRKNFLLLFLMTLLPLAGFAADLSKGKIVVPSPFYGEAPTEAGISVYNEANDPLTQNTHYVFDGFFADKACTSSLTEDQIKSKAVGTVMYAKVTGMNGYENSLVGSFEVKPMELTVTITNASKTYGEADPASFAIASVKLHGGADAAAAVVSDIQVARVAGENAATYNYTASMKTNNNYIVKEPVLGTFTINPKGFVKGTDITITVTANLTYNGAEQKATIAVKDKQSNAVLVENKDYTITWTNNIAASAEAKATIKGKGNYKTTDSNDELFTIKAAPLLVTPAAKKTYNGEDALSAVTYTYQGFVDAMTKDNVNVGLSACTVTDPSANVGTYKLNITNNVFTLANYQFIPVEGEFVIEQREVTVTVNNDLLHEYGTPEVFTWGLAGNIAGDAAALNNAIKVTRADAPNANGEYALTPSFKSDAEIDATDLSAANKAAAKQAVKNYKMTAENGKLTYDKAPLQIALKESAYTLTKVYDGQPVSVDLDKDNGLIIIGLKGDDQVDKANLTLSVVANSAKVGSYQLKLDGAVAANYNITYIPSQYTITQKDLKVYIGNQTFVKGQALNLNQLLFTIDEEKGLAEGDKANEVFKLTTDIVTGGDPEVITSDAGYYEINLVDVGGDNSKFANYSVTTENIYTDLIDYGVATVLGEDAIVLDESKDLTNLTGDADELLANVTFSSRNLKKGVWYTMALPFDITVRDLSALMGYVIVDKFVANESSSDMNFKIFMGKINAYEPFLIKCDQDVNLNEKNLVGITLKKYANCTANMTQENASYYFKSNFKYAAVGENFWTDGSNMTAEQFKFNKYAGTAKLKALRAYITAKPGVTAAPNIFVEEPDGSVTAIQGITADGVAVEKTGWYTINGIKLESAPTEKGVYIRNGKKMVIK